MKHDGSPDRRHDNRHRYYAHADGRYVQGDPVGQLGGLNLHTYALNSPLNAADPLGLSTQLPHPNSPDIVFGPTDYVDRNNPGLRCRRGRMVVFIPGLMKHLDEMKECPQVLECIDLHERRHRQDFEFTHPRPCKGAPNGWVPAWRSRERLRASEVRAYSAELRCLQGKLDETCDEKCRGIIKNAMESAGELRDLYRAGELP